MANGQSSFAAALQAGGSTPNVHVRANQNDVNQRVRGFCFDYTGQGNETAAEYVDLGPIGLASALIIPESLRIRFDGAGNFSLVTSIVKVFGDAEPVAATWSRSTTTATATTAAPHGFAVGQVLAVTVSSSTGAIAIGNVTVASVTGLYSFTFTCTDAGAASGTITIGPAAGSLRTITTAAGFTQAAVYVGVAATFGSPVELKKKDRLRIVWGAITTAIPTTRKLFIEGLALSKN